MDTVFWKIVEGVEGALIGEFATMLPRGVLRGLDRPYATALAGTQDI